MSEKQTFIFVKCQDLGVVGQHTLVYADVALLMSLKVWRLIYIFSIILSPFPQLTYMLYSQNTVAKKYGSLTHSLPLEFLFFFNLPFLGFINVFYWEEGQSKKNKSLKFSTPKIMKVSKHLRLLF